MNFRSFAELIQQHVEQLTGRKTTIKTLAIAILGHGDIIMVVTRTGWTAAYDELRREVA